MKILSTNMRAGGLLIDFRAQDRDDGVSAVMQRCYERGVPCSPAAPAPG
jgi:hypothetical protein